MLGGGRVTSFVGGVDVASHVNFFVCGKCEYKKIVVVYFFVVVNVIKIDYSHSPQKKNCTVCDSDTHVYNGNRKPYNIRLFCTDMCGDKTEVM